jgi:hypothetical protein
VHKSERLLNQSIFDLLKEKYGLNIGRHVPTDHSSSGRKSTPLERGSKADEEAEDERRNRTCRSSEGGTRARGRGRGAEFGVPDEVLSMGGVRYVHSVLRRSSPSALPIRGSRSNSRSTSRHRGEDDSQRESPATAAAAALASPAEAMPLGVVDWARYVHNRVEGRTSYQSSSSSGRGGGSISSGSEGETGGRGDEEKTKDEGSAGGAGGGVGASSRRHRRRHRGHHPRSRSQPLGRRRDEEKEEEEEEEEEEESHDVLPRARVFAREERARLLPRGHAHAKDVPLDEHGGLH